MCHMLVDSNLFLEASRLIYTSNHIIAAGRSVGRNMDTKFKEPSGGGEEKHSDGIAF
jgi:hypothetical protein